MADACNALQSLAKSHYFMLNCNSIILIKFKTKTMSNTSECFTWFIYIYK